MPSPGGHPQKTAFPVSMAALTISRYRGTFTVTIMVLARSGPKRRRTFVALSQSHPTAALVSLYALNLWHDSCNPPPDAAVIPPRAKP